MYSISTGHVSEKTRKFYNVQKTSLLSKHFKNVFTSKYFTSSGLSKSKNYQKNEPRKLEVQNPSSFKEVKVLTLLSNAAVKI